MRILIGVDGSEGSLVAVETIGKLVPEGSEFTVYCTPPEVTLRAPGGAESSLIERATKAVAEAILAEAVARLPAGAQGQAQKLTGTEPPRHGILKAAESTGADLIVVGARGQGPIQTLLLGSVSTAVARAARVPVMIVRPKWTSESGPFSVLLATDGSEVSRHAGDFLGKLSPWAGCECRLMTVIESQTCGALPDWLEKRARDHDSEAMAQAWNREYQADLESHRADLVKFAQTLPPGFAKHEPIVAAGNAAEQILQTIETHAIDLVVLGSTGKGMFERWLVGSTSEKVLNHTRACVLLVPGPLD